jgi:hypothetical protein
VSELLNSCSCVLSYNLQLNEEGTDGGYMQFTSISHTLLLCYDENRFLRKRFAWRGGQPPWFPYFTSLELFYWCCVRDRAFQTHVRETSLLRCVISHVDSYRFKKRCSIKQMLCKIIRKNNIEWWVSTQIVKPSQYCGVFRQCGMDDIQKTWLQQ